MAKKPEGWAYEPPRGTGQGTSPGMQRMKTNAPTFAYQTVYGEDPPEFIPGRTAAPKKMWKGIEVDKGLKNKWLNALNSLPVEIRSTDEGKSAMRPAFVIIRMPEGQDHLHKKMAAELQRYPGLQVKSEIGMMGRPRICVAGRIWKGQPGWDAWWESLAGKISDAYQKVGSLEKRGSVLFNAFVDELEKISGEKSKSKWVWQGRRYKTHQDYMKAKYSGKGRSSLPA